MFQYIIISVICNIGIMVSIGLKWMIQHIHTYMLIVLKTWKNSINHFNIIAKHWVACVSIYCNRCKLQLVSNNFNTLKINGSIHVHIVESWKDF